jgi:hypothetical protein
LNSTKQLEQKPAPMLPIPRLSYFKGGIVGLVAGDKEESDDTPRPTPIMFGGEKAEGIDQDKLQEARRMVAEGRNPNDIYAQTRTDETTGWFARPDQKLRFEFSDKDAALNKDVLEDLRKNNTTTLGNLLQHDQLFKHYPAAKDVTVRPLTEQESSMGFNAAFDPKKNELAVSTRPDKNAIKSVLHEVQHYIEGQEKFAPGGDLGSYWDAGYRLSRERDKLEKNFKNESDNIYADLLEKGVPEEEAKRRIDIFSQNFYREQIDPLKQREIEYRKTTDNGNPFTPFKVYKQLSGETEARNVSRRHRMSLEQRSASIPTESEDVPMDKQFILPQNSYSKGGIVSLVDAAEEVRAAGRKNDTILAHINPAEAMFLKRLGGAGTTNPYTGLLEFDDDGGGGSGDSGGGGTGNGNDSGNDNGNDAGGGGQNGNETSGGLGGGLGGGWGDDSNNQSAPEAAPDAKAENPEAKAEAKAEDPQQNLTAPQIEAKSESLLQNVDLLANNLFANTRAEFVAPSPALEQFFAPPSNPEPMVAPTQDLSSILGNTRSGEFGLSGPVGSSMNAQESMGMNNLGTFGLNGPVSTQTYNEMVQDFKDLSNAKSDTAPVTPDMPFAERMAAFNPPLAWEMPPTPDQRMAAFTPDMRMASRSTNAPAAPSAPAASQTVAANPEFWNTVSSPVFNNLQFAAPAAPAAAQTVAAAAPTNAPNAVAPVASSTSYTATPSFWADPAGWLSAKAENVASNPGQYATNAMMMGVPVAGTLNTLSGLLGGPTVGSIMQAGTPAGPEALSASLGAEGYSGIPKPQDNSPSSTSGTPYRPTTSLNLNALYDLNDFLSPSKYV